MRLTHPFGLLTLLSSLLLSMSACGTYIKVTSVRPAVVHLGSDPDVSVTEVDGGRRNLQDALVEQLIALSRQGGFISVKDRRDAGVRFTLSNRKPVFAGAEATIGEREFFLSVKIVEAEVETEEAQEKRTVKGKTLVSTYKILKASAAISATLVNAETSFIAEKEYTGRASVRKNEGDKDSLKEQAIRQCVQALLNDITPKNITQQIEMDDSDDAQKTFLDLAGDGKVAEARQGLSDYVKKNPNKASAHYNLAVLIDSMGEYAEALKSYDAAIKAGSKPLYVKARAACAQRQTEQDEMSK